MAEEKLVKSVMFICPTCEFEMFESVEQLMKNHGWDGKDLKKLPAFECHGCHITMVKATKLQEIPASWVDPWPEEDR